MSRERDKVRGKLKCPVCGAGRYRYCKEWIGGGEWRPRTRHWERYKLERDRGKV